jgi:hypothetical protein
MKKTPAVVRPHPGSFVRTLIHSRARKAVVGGQETPGICDFEPDDFQYLYRIPHLELAVDNCREDYGVCDR